MADRVFENLWDCPACGKVGNSAFKQKHCPQCGYAKTPQDEEYMGNQITNEEDLKVAGKTKDWVCSSCGATNYQKNDFCEQCGNPKESDDKVNVAINYGASAPTTAKEAKARSHPRQHEPVETDDISFSGSGFSQPDDIQIIGSEGHSSLLQLAPNVWRYGLIALGVLLVALLFFGIFHTKSMTGSVSGFTWSRDIQIEVYKTIRHTHESSYPFDAYNIRSYEESRQVPVYRTETTHHPQTCTTYTNNGDGTTTEHTEDCSYDTSEQIIDHYDTVWDTYYDYDRDQWVYERTAHTEGADQEPFWPEFTLNLSGQQVLGAERTGLKSETYVVIFTTYDKKENRKDYSYTTSLADWSLYQLEVSYPLKINSFGAIMNNPLQDKMKVVATPLP